MKLIPVIFVCWNRASYIEQTLYSYLTRLKVQPNRYTELLKLFVYSQGSDRKSLDVMGRFAKHYHGVKIISDNEGFGTGLSKGFEWVKGQIDFDYFILLEDDWFLAEPLNKYLKELITLMGRRPDIGYIRLRNVAERVNPRNRFTNKRLRGKFETEHIYVTNYHYTSNPQIMRKEVMEKIVPFKRERGAMIKYNKLNLLTGQLHAYCFSHIGVQRGEGWMN